VSSSNAETRAPRRRLLLWVTLGSGAGLIVVLFLIAARVPFSSETLRQQVVATLSERLDADVELKELHIRIFPRFHAEGIGLAIREKKRGEVPPLITVKTFEIHADLAGLLRKHVAQVGLNGLEIDIPPGEHHDDGAGGTRKAGEAGKAGGAGGVAKAGAARDVIVDNLVSTDARLVIIPRKEGKQPKIWEIHKLHMGSVSFDRSMPFEATLTNAVPPGEIETNGNFGPWIAPDPGATPLDGTFTFAHADLSVFKGISGMLSAHGTFGGALERIDIHGETKTPQFTVAVSGHPVPLQAKYHAIVDGTNGDTILERIDGSFLKTSLVAHGSVVDLPGKPGREVVLDIAMDDARIEDVLRLAVKAAKPPMIGALKLATKFVLPPGHQDVVDKLRLDGQFAIAHVEFTEINIQGKINELSHRSRGKSPDAAQQHVASDFKGRFKLADGMLTLPVLTFATPGAAVSLAGSYALRPEQLAFTGTLSMDAKVSETQTGFKRVLLKVVDPLFSKDGGGSAIPIRIEGQRSAPSFGLDKGRVFHRGGQPAPAR
jgi:hypothetical protein